MARFRSAEAFFSPQDLQLLPLRFERLENDCFAVSNLVGDLLLLNSEELERITSLKFACSDKLYELAFEKLLVAHKGQIASLQLLALRMRSRMAFLRDVTPLHIFVVTLRCEHSCPYCQVSRQSSDRTRFDMSKETAMRAIEVALTAPSRSIKIEFQGGEPLLNFELVRMITEEVRTQAPVRGKTVDFVIASNLALLTDETLSFCKENGVSLSTSLDGPEDLHNHNRPRPGGNSYALAVAGIGKAQKVLGHEHVSALMTTTEASLDRAEEIVDEYVDRGLGGIFLRPLSPYGFAVKTKQFSRYNSQRWLAFYARGLRHIIAKNKEGHAFPEFYAKLLLTRMFSDNPTGYVDLRSPAGIGLGALVYNYDGKVFASDEGRMLAEMGDRTFELGDLQTDDYRSLILSQKMIDMIGESLAQCAPQCNVCAYQAICGAEPVYHHTTQGDFVGIKPVSDFCRRQKGVLKRLLETLENDGEDAAVLRGWVGG